MFILSFILLLVAIGTAVYYLFFSPSSQIFGKVYYQFKPTGKQIALTFDDGPNEPYTSELLAILKTHKVKCTFFTCGACIDRHPGTLQNIHLAGHAIGNHSHDHILSHYLRPRQYITEVMKTSNKIEAITGVKPTLYRSPWLFRTPGLLASINKLGLTPVWGIFGSEIEVFQPSPVRMAKRALGLAKPGWILIFHDGKEGTGGDRANTVKAIEILVPKLLKQGYEFVTLDQEIFKA